MENQAAWMIDESQERVMVTGQLLAPLGFKDFTSRIVVVRPKAGPNSAGETLCPPPPPSRSFRF